MVKDSDSLGSEEDFKMLTVPAEPGVTQQEQQFLLDQFRHLSIVRMFPDKQQKIKVSKGSKLNSP